MRLGVTGVIDVEFPTQEPLCIDVVGVDGGIYAGRKLYDIDGAFE